MWVVLGLVAAFARVPVELGTASSAEHLDHFLLDPNAPDCRQVWVDFEGMGHAPRIALNEESYKCRSDRWIKSMRSVNRFSLRRAVNFRDTRMQTGQPLLAARWEVQCEVCGRRVRASSGAVVDDAAGFLECGIRRPQRSAQSALGVRPAAPRGDSGTVRCSAFAGARSQARGASLGMRARVSGRGR
jgi:hypothetical protein